MPENIQSSEKTQIDIIAKICHEIRTPVTAIHATTEALLSGAKDDPQMLENFLHTILRESDRLSTMICRCTEIARCSTHTIHRHMSCTSLRTVARRVIQSMGEIAIRSNVELSIDMPDITLQADEYDLEQLLTNLLDNAIKYTPSGGSVILNAMEDLETVTITVIDSGIGIPKDELSRVFHRFYRSETARSRRIYGTGLGLSIVKEIVDFYSGKIDIDSSVGHGSTFTVVLPKSVASQTTK